jgi:hypothetical protein
MPDTQTITLQLPTHLLEATHQLIQQEKITTIDEFITLALQNAILNLQPSETQSPALEHNPGQTTDPIGELGKNPVIGGISDASANLDHYLYRSL